ncbi:hypothetical protein BJX76DRAFT_62600 [Aspergillus varians]
MTRYPEDSNAPGVIVMTRFLMVTLILGSLTRLGTKWWKFRTIFQDDYYILLAMLAAIAESVAVSVAVNNGYGMHMAQLSDGQIAHVLKAQYASNFFYILGIAFSQLSFLCFVKHLTSHSRRVFTGMQIGIAVCAITGFLGSAFQCRPRQWDYIHDRCFNREAWFIYIAGSMIVTEIAIIAQTVIVMIKVQTTWRRKANLMTIFLFRVFVPGALIAQIVLIHKTFNASDPTWTTWSTTICTQLALCLSVVTASTPQFVPVLRQLQSSGMRLDGMTRHTLSSNAQYDSRSKYFISGRRTGNESSHELDNIPFATTKTTITGTHGQSLEDDHDDESQSSQTGIIRETRTWIVTEELVQNQH